MQSTTGGPAIEAAGPQIAAMRARADADRPYLAEIESVIDRWHDDDETYTSSLALIDAAQHDYDTLRADADSDPLDVASAAQHLNWLKETVLPKHTPAERWYPALREATERREAAAGGAEQHRHPRRRGRAAGAMPRPRTTDSSAPDAPTCAASSTNCCTAESAAARAFAEAQMRTADHITEQLPRITTELRVLAAAGHNTFQPPLHLDPEALAKLSASPALAGVRGGQPLRRHPRHRHRPRRTHPADGRPGQPPHGPDDRHIVWSAPDDVLNDPHTSALHAEMVDAATLRFEPATTAPGTIVVVDHAQRLTPTEIADLAESAMSADVRLVLIDTDTRQWSTAPSAPLLRLLNKDLPWSRTLSVDPPSATTPSHPSPPTCRPHSPRPAT